MTNMDDRLKAFESKYAYDQEVTFKIEARACKLFGLWVAEQMGLTGDDAKTFAGLVVAANLDEPGFGDVLRMVQGELAAKNIDLSEHALDTKFATFLEEARQQVVNEAK